MFDFLGTMSEPEFKELEKFAIEQKEDIADRIKHLEEEFVRVGGGAISLLGKMKRADKNLEGVTHEKWEPEHLKLREDIHKRVNKGHPDWTEDRTEFTSRTMMDDGSAAEVVDLIKNWMHGPIEYKRERLEWKVKRVFDLLEQIEKEIERLEIADGELGEWIAFIYELSGKIEHKRHVFVRDDRPKHGVRIDKEDIIETNMKGQKQPA